MYFAALFSTILNNRLHLVPYDQIFVAVTIIRTGIVLVGDKAHIFILVHIHVADIGLAVLIIDIIGAAVAAA